MINFKPSYYIYITLYKIIYILHEKGKKVIVKVTFTFFNTTFKYKEDKITFTGVGVLQISVRKNKSSVLKSKYGDNG